MARKQAIQNDARVQEAVEEFRAMTEVRYDLAKAAYDHQDKETQKVINRMVDRLRLGATGYIEVRVNPPHGSIVPVKIEQQYLDFNLLYVACEILKDLAMFDIRVGTYEFPPSICAMCGAEMTKEQPRKKGGKRG